MNQRIFFVVHNTIVHNEEHHCVLALNDRNEEYQMLPVIRLKIVKLKYVSIY